jgi:hypothetical protein
MGDLILFPQRERRAVWNEAVPTAVGAASIAARADEGDEWLDRLTMAIALGHPPDSGEARLCEVVPLRKR